MWWEVNFSLCTHLVNKFLTFFSLILQLNMAKITARPLSLTFTCLVFFSRWCWKFFKSRSFVISSVEQRFGNGWLTCLLNGPSSQSLVQACDKRNRKTCKWHQLQWEFSSIKTWCLPLSSSLCSRIQQIKRQIKAESSWHRQNANNPWRGHLQGSYLVLLTLHFIGLCCLCLL